MKKRFNLIGYDRNNSNWFRFYTEDVSCDLGEIHRLKIAVFCHEKLIAIFKEKIR